MKKVKEIITPKGVLSYRMPDVFEAYDLIEISGINEVRAPQSDDESAPKVKPFTIITMKRNIIGEMGFLVDYSNIGGANSYQDLIDDAESMMSALDKIAEEFAVIVLDTFKKKEFIDDAIRVLRSGMTLQQLRDAVEIPGTENDIWEVRKIVIAYTQFKSTIDLGLHMNPGDLPFQKTIMFSWIKEAIESGRKTNI